MAARSRAHPPQGPAVAAPAPARRTPDLDHVQHLQRTIGNRAVAGIIAGMEQATGFALDGVRIHERSALADAARVHGIAIGRDVHLATGLATEPAVHRDHVVRHELAHVVQQATDASADPIALEHAAERVAEAARGEPGAIRELRPLPSGRTQPQAYDPRFHRRVTVHGLVGTGFSDQQIGQIYAANWERDLSQAHPVLGNTILCWKEVKVAAYRRDAGAFARASTELRRTVAELLDLALEGAVADIASAKSYGGYRFYHHFDNPTAASFTKKPQEPEGLTTATATALRDRSAGIPRHLIDSREYVKAQLVEAVRRYRGDFDKAPAIGVRDAFVAREQVLRGAIAARQPYVWGKPVNDADDPAGTLSSPLTAETALQASRERARRGVGEGSALDPKRFTPAIADAIGRAGHALEDFFSHSNFVELALGEPTPGMPALDTGTFETEDSMHALSHKLRGLVDDLGNNTILLGAALSDGKLPEGALRMDLASEEMPQPSPPYVAGIWTGFPRVARDIGRLKSGEPLTFQQAEASSGQLLARLGALSDELETYTRKHAAAGSHTLIAKDQPGHHPGDPASEYKTRKFLFAQALSEAADRMVLGMLPGAMTAATPGDANAMLEAVFALLDRLIAPPTPAHPLWSIIETATKLLGSH